MVTPIEVELVRSLSIRLHDTPHGQKGTAIQEVAAALGCDTRTLRLKADRMGFPLAPRRPPRVDKGKTKVADDDLALVAAVAFAANRDGKADMPFRVLIENLYAQKKLLSQAHPATFSRKLRQRQLHPKQLQKPSQAKRLSTDGPNDVWQMDCTTGVLYYAPGEGLVLIDPADHNKNKLHNLNKVSDQLLTLIVFTDHASGAFKAIFVRGGESAENTIRALTYAFDKQPGCPMHGVPRILMADRGPGNTSSALRDYFARLGCTLMLHKARNARATGSVEQTHNTIQKHFDPRLRFMDARSLGVDELNALLWEWLNHFNATQKHSRTGMPRYEAWMHIKPEALRVVSSELLREAAIGKTESARVDNTLHVQFKTRPYYLQTVPGVEVGDKVRLRPNYFRFPTIDVESVNPITGETSWHAVAPDELDEFGYDGRHVIGAGFQALPDSLRDTNRKALLREAHRTGDALPTLEQAERARRDRAPAFLGRIDPMADVRATDLPAYLPRPGVEIAATWAATPVQPRLLNAVEVCKVLRQQLGNLYGSHIYTLVTARIDALECGGLTEVEVDVLRSEMATAATELRRAVGGDGI